MPNSSTPSSTQRSRLNELSELTRRSFFEQTLLAGAVALGACHIDGSAARASDPEGRPGESPPVMSPGIDPREQIKQFIVARRWIDRAGVDRFERQAELHECVNEIKSQLSRQVSAHSGFPDHRELWKTEQEKFAIHLKNRVALPELDYRANPNNLPKAQLEKSTRELERWIENFVPAHNTIARKVDEHLCRFAAQVISTRDLAPIRQELLLGRQAAEERMRASVSIEDAETGAVQRWTERRGLLGKIERRRAVDDGEQVETYAAGRRTLRLETRGSERHSISYFSNGRIYQESYSEQASDGWRLKHFDRFRSDGTIECHGDVSRGESLHYGIDGKRIAGLIFDPFGRAAIDRYVVGKDGVQISDYPEMRRHDPRLSKSQYLDLLAQQLDTPERLHWYFTWMIKYADDLDRNGKITETWRSSYQTLEYVGDKRMWGDCEDCAFLARDVMRRRGERAEVVHLDQHAECFWLRRDGTGRYHAYSLSQRGFVHNGNRFGDFANPERESGYGTPAQAMEQRIQQLREGELLNVPNFEYALNPQKIRIWEFDPITGSSSRRDVRIEELIRY